MEYLPPYFDEDDTERVFDSPAVEIETVIGKIVLTHLNSRLRVFNNSMANHVEFRDDDDNLRAFAAPQEIIDQMFQMEWPMLSLPYIDQATGVWMRQNCQQTMEQELKDLL